MGNEMNPKIHRFVRSSQFESAFILAEFGFNTTNIESTTLSGFPHMPGVHRAQDRGGPRGFPLQGGCPSSEVHRES